MTAPVPAHPKIYHIVHVDNLASIVTDGCLWPDAIMAQRRAGRIIGNPGIKSDRLVRPVDCHAGTCVGDYVPFYFCPRSVMLYVISKRNHPDIAYRDGQAPIVHLMADLRETVAWAAAANQHWAFTAINAASRAADFFDDLDRLDQINWDIVAADHWASQRDFKMAEFLLHGAFPWHLVRGIGVQSTQVGRAAMAAFGAAAHRPLVKVKQAWYY